MVDHAVVPYGDVVLFPAEPGVEVWVCCKLVVEEVESVVALGLADASDTASEASVNENGLDACRRVHADDRMKGLNWWPTDVLSGALRPFGLLDAGVDGVQGLEVFLVVG